MRLWIEDSRTEIVVAPHHSDRLRRPLPKLVAPRSRDSALLRAATNSIAAPISGTWGGLSWSGLAAVAQNCADASSLPSIEQALARNALNWLQSVDIQPAG